MVKKKLLKLLDCNLFEGKLDKLKDEIYPKKGNFMTLGSKIKQLRQTRGWSQAELADQIGVTQKQISAYERGTSNPTTEVLIKIAEIFDVSLDFLALDRTGSSSQGKIKDRQLLEYFEIIDGFPENQKAAAKQVLDLICFKNRITQLTGTGK